MSFLIGENMTGGYGGANILNNCTISVDLGQIAVIVGYNDEQINRHESDFWHVGFARWVGIN